jgi:carbamate kinase
MARPVAVVAIGGNALAQPGRPLDVATQRATLVRPAGTLARLTRTHRLVLTHGNGPQVGRLAALEAADADPFDVLDASTAGALGYLLCEALDAAGAPPAVAVVTRVVVDPADPAFARPTKPVGGRLDARAAQELTAARGWTFVHAADGSARRVVPSPPPLDIVEVDAIAALVDAGHTVICGGGGGVPVAGPAGRRRGVEAVVDKDRTAALLAQKLDAEVFVVLTDVEAVLVDPGAPHRERIRTAAPAALEVIRFDPGSMGPKVEAACAFAERTRRVARIGHLDRLADVLADRAGTRIALDDPFTTEPERTTP